MTAQHDGKGGATEAPRKLALAQFFELQFKGSDRKEIKP
jgi:hypothetical protein